MRNIAFIPARGGSKRIHKKNIKFFHGKPIIQYSIETLLKSKLFSNIIVSTDDKEIKEVVKSMNVTIHDRKKYADDYTPTYKVIENFLLENKKYINYNNLCCVYATAPFLQKNYLIEAYNKLEANNINSVFSIKKYDFPIQRSLKYNKNMLLKMVNPEYELTRSNDLEKRYHDAGQFYFLKIKNFLKELKIYSQKSMGIILPSHLVQDIDTPDDWKKAEIMYEILKKGGYIKI